MPTRSKIEPGHYSLIRMKSRFRVVPSQDRSRAKTLHTRPAASAAGTAPNLCRSVSHSSRSGFSGHFCKTRIGAREIMRSRSSRPNGGRTLLKHIAAFLISPEKHAG
jgi:hypothetical protein